MEGDGLWFREVNWGSFAKSWNGAGGQRDPGRGVSVAQRERGGGGGREVSGFLLLLLIHSELSQGRKKSNNQESM